MFLKYLELQGFKSFPDKVKIDFNMGITGIVGPNGSGKSNISDAIRWVMGEQSAKTLRGGKMEDVIFAGTADRKPVGFAEVSICFDNLEKLFKIDYDEVLITRRYFRSGESEYYINKTSCRLKDIHELFMDTGMGRDGYSVIGQGKIENIVSSKPEDRRYIFEEAAGISKFKYRKAESERKLEQTSENLIRILDLISEVESRLEPLKRDSEKAQKYLDYKDELKEIEISLFLNIVDRIKVDSEKFKNNLYINNSDTEKQTAALNQLEEKQVKLNEKMRENEVHNEDLIRKLYEIKNKISAYQNDISLLTSSKAHNNENVERILNEIKQLETENEVLKKSADTKLSQKSAVQDKINILNEKLEEKLNEYSKVDSGIENSNSEYENLNKLILELYQSRSEISSEIASLNAENISLKNQMLSFDEDKEILQEDIEIHTNHIKKYESDLKEKQADTDKINSQLEILRENLNLLNDKAENIKRIDTDLSIHIEKSEARQKLLSDMETDMDGYAHSVKTVIKENKTGVLKNLRIHGTLSDIIKIDDKYTVAVEAVLGNNLQNIVIENEQDAKSAIEYLKQVKGGRATFLPVSAMKGTKLDEDEFKNEKGFIAIACDLVKCDDKYNPVIVDALGRTLIVDNVDNAIAISKKFKQRYKLSTLQGEVFNPGGSITGGNLNKNFSFLSRKSEIEKLTKEISEALLKKKQNLSEFEKLKNEIELVQESFDKTNSNLLLSNNELIRIEYNIKHYTELLENTKNELKNFTSKEDDINLRISENAKTVETLEQKLKDLENEIIASQKRADDTQSAASDNSKIVKGLNADIIKIRLDISDLENERLVLEQGYVTDTASVELNNSRIAEKNSEIYNTTDKDGTIAQKIQKINELIEEETNNYNRCENEIEELKNIRLNDDETLKLVASDIKKANDIILELAQEKVRIENKISKCDSEFESITTRLWDEYQLTYVTAESYRKTIDNPQEVQKQVNSIRQSIKLLGDVNVGAIEEYKATNDRFLFLTIQKNDLEKAKETLNEVIKDMETMMSKQFLEQINVINNAFSKIFKEMFDGGEAELVLTDTEDILNCGVEIHAQPPGKKLQNMTLFSGGEKAIIAISLMFALLEVRPSPLCIFDEVEAALDDINVYKFAAYLRKISKKSQIAVITHRRGTMEEVDILYGVTMQEKGVSKLLQLNINDVESKMLSK